MPLQTGGSRWEAAAPFTGMVQQHVEYRLAVAVAGNPLGLLLTTAQPFPQT